MIEIIIKNPVCVQADDSLETVNRLINSEGHFHLPVVEGRKVIGVVSKADLSSRYLKIMEKDEDCNKPMNQIQVKEIMNSNPVTVKFDTTLDLAIEVFLKNEVSALIVVDEDMNLKGLITSFDLLQYVLAA